jgi:glutathione S-transferase
VVDIDGFRLIETAATARYLDAALPGPFLVPSDPKNAARMDMVTSIIDSYGYGPMIGRVAAYHLFPDLVGGKNDKVHREALGKSRRVMSELVRIRGSSPYLAGEEVSIADLYLAPVFAYLALTPHRDEFVGLPGVGEWWERISARDSFRSTQPS